MAHYKLIILEPAINEISESVRFYNSKQEHLGDEFEAEIFEVFEVIKTNPNLFPIKFENIHEAVVTRFPFVITYEVYKNEIIISSVFHTKRNPKHKLNRNL